MGTSSDEKLTPYSRIKREAVEWVVPGLVPAGMLTVLAGPQGLGKSLLYCAWAASLASEGHRTIICNGEDSPTHTTKPRLEALQADQDAILNANVSPVFGNGTGDLWYREIGEWIFEHKARLLILDPLAAFLDTQADVFRDHHVRRLLEPLGFIAQALNCAIVYVKHVKKGQESDLLSRVTDSVAFTAAARSVVMMAREGEYSSRLRLVCHAKSNVSELAPIQRWEVVPILLSNTAESPEVRTAKLHYIGAAEGAELDAIYRVHDPEEANERAQAEEMIRSLLAFGEVPSRDLDSEADAMGISRRTVMRARSALGVEAVKKGRTWFVFLSQRKDATGRVPTPPGTLHSPANDGEEAGRVPQTSRGTLPSESVSQSPPAQGSFEWIGTAPWDELRDHLTDP